jgi:hypothetical protein
MESTIPITPSTLVSMADEECQVLKHSSQWVETIDPSVAAMQAMIQADKEGSAKFFQTLATNFTELSNKQRDNRDIRMQHYDRNRMNNNPDWIFTPPTDLSEARTFRGRQWHFCTKCGHNGRWVYTHTDATHCTPNCQDLVDGGFCHHRQNSRDAYPYDQSSSYYNREYWDRSPRSRSPYRSASRSRSPQAKQEHSVSFRPPTPNSPSAQLSLFDSIADFMSGP